MTMPSKARTLQPGSFPRQVQFDFVHLVEWLNNLSMLLFFVIGLLLLVIILLVLFLQSQLGLWLGAPSAWYGVTVALVAFGIITMYAVERKRRRLESQLLAQKNK